ncbi:hypothetical protein NliqN6_2805 [Naganishia liquefaciens]|uniref:Endoplasmic reticulum-based factor for assembly of V-ATPase-domain-containing protein n=1 Tax=Naganishia liquefaciens TaxID=104408 RepID=A0A8H3TT43_9TREE|nr:hypothetical protein NliqN6_2805 [Naganishia liquefaciens]
MSDATLISITPDLEESLKLLQSDRFQLSDEVRRRISESLSEYAKLQSEIAMEASESGHNTTQKGNVYIPYSTLLEIRRWSRLPKSSRALARAQIDANRYSMIALCAGTRAFTSSAQERLFKTDPTAASAFLPSTFHSKPKSIAGEYRSIRKEISTVLNVLFSIGGVGGAVYVVAHTSAGMSQESAILLAFFAAAVTAFAEIWLWVAYSRRSARRAKEGEALRLAEMRQAGPSEVESEVPDKPELKEISADPLDEKSQGEIPNHMIPSKTTEKREIRLRRRPLGEAL